LPPPGDTRPGWKEREREREREREKEEEEDLFAFNDTIESFERETERELY
jgi:hypothetical protein